MGAICGIDWASDWHDVHISDEHGELLAAEQFSHDELGVSAMTELLLDHRVECCAIERPDGLLVGRLLAAGIVVLAIHPNQVKAARERFRAAAGKNDRFDAFVLCELARTDRHRFPVLAPSDDETLALKALVRTREDLVAARVALANQLRAQLQTFWPGAERIFADVDSPIALAFLERYPSPADARSLGEKRLEGFLARHAYCGRRTPAELLARLRAAPNAVLGELEGDARRSAVIGLTAALGPIVEQISQLTSQIAGATRAHPDGAIFLAFFRDRTLTNMTEAEWDAVSPAPDDILLFPRGPAAGDCLHRMFELADFASTTGWAGAIDRALRERPVVAGAQAAQHLCLELL